MTTDAAQASGLSPALAEETPLLSLRGINKSFGAIHVLKDVDFDAYAGKVTALVGDNGAGKSTLVKGVAGTYPFDHGRYFTSFRMSYGTMRPVAGLDIGVIRLRSMFYTATAGYSVSRWLRAEGFFTGAHQTSSARGEVDRARIGFQFVTSKPVRIE